MTEIIIDQVRIIGTNRTVWKAWKPCEKRAAWPGGYDYHTITHFAGRIYGRIGSEVLADPRLSSGDSLERQAAWNERAIAKAAAARAAHLEILRAMPMLVASAVTFDDDGTIVVEG